MYTKKDLEKKLNIIFRVYRFKYQKSTNYARDIFQMAF